MRRALLATAALALLAGCAAVGPAELPKVAAPATFKEAGAPWVNAAPSAPPAWDHWWEACGDAELNALQQKLVANSPDLAAALARYKQAQAVTQTLRAAGQPSLTGSLNAQRDRQSELKPLRVLGPTSPNEYNSATLGLDLEYEVDLWGRVSASVAAGVASEQAAGADLAGARLALQAQLADDWLALRGLDQQAQLLRDTETAYAKALDLVSHRHGAGIASGLDLARAQAQLEEARSQAGQLQAQRALLEHAIAALVGANPSDFSIAPRTAETALPAVPLDVPSTLLQRRPDIAAAEQRVIAANASVGVAHAALFPAVTLSAMGGYQSSQFGRFIEAPNLWWALGPNLVGTLFDGGRRHAEEDRTRAVLDEASQRYRATVLGAFQQVEDQLALLAHNGDALKNEQQVAASAQAQVQMSGKLYEAGAASYLEVVTAQTNWLQAQRSVLDLGTRQRRAWVQLVRALGGGWSPRDGQQTAQAAGA
ncbi:MAG: efflux transporter outer membrane subunit [Paucibacter sp.]|nr:efflux transporter outer membrane subunit [Roseateles sp.]